VFSSQKSFDVNANSFYKKQDDEDTDQNLELLKPHMNSVNVSDSISHHSIGEDDHFEFSPIRDHFSSNE
jgi:hypothetical protein